MKKEDWISVNDKLPEDSKEVLVHAPGCTINGPVLIGNYYDDSKEWVVHEFGSTEYRTPVTHWMPTALPY